MPPASAFNYSHESDWVMPVSRKEFESGETIPDLDKKLEAWFRSHADLAYSDFEVASAMLDGKEFKVTNGWEALGKILGGVANSWLVQEALARLAKRGVVEATMVKNSWGNLERHWILKR